MASNVAESEPQILELPDQKMVVVYARGTPESVFPRVLPVLYGCVYALKFELQRKGRPAFSIGGLRARYPDAHLVPVSEWTHVIGLPVPDDTSSVPQKAGETEVKIEIWKYGTIAQALYSGHFAGADTAVQRLHNFVEESGHEIIGVHEEEYLTPPGTGNTRTIIRYRVRKK